MIDMRMQILGAATVVGLLCGGVQSSQALAGTAKTAQKSSAARKVSPYRSEKLTDSAKVFYVATWGIDKVKVSYTASGNLIRFSYRVVDAQLAKPLGDVKETPSLLGQKSRALLQIPVMEKVGQLRQTGTPQVGQEYWMVFSNKGNWIRPGDRVNVTIGIFHADGLMVERT